VLRYAGLLFMARVPGPAESVFPLGFQGRVFEVVTPALYQYNRKKNFKKNFTGSTWT